MATVTVNVQANTSDATNDVNQLDNALEGADKAAEGLNNSLEKQEARIKTLGGAINIVGGSVEVLAGSLALSGALSEEQAEKFESAAIGAIALADGTKRVFEGVKELNEGLSGLGGITGVVTKAFARLRAAALANPYVALAAGLALVGVAVAKFIKDTKDEENESAKLNRTLDEQIEIDRQGALEGEARAIEEINQLEAALLGNRKIDREETEKQLELAKRRRDGAREFLNLLFDTEVAYEDLAEKAKNAPGGSESKALTFYVKPKIVTPAGDQEVDTIAEYFEAQTAIDPPVLRPIIKPDYQEADLGETTLLERAEVLGGKIGEAISSPAAQAIGSQLDAAAQFTAALVEVVDDGTKEGFEASKKYKIAEVITSATQASFQAFAAAQQFGPILGPILGAAQVAAIAAASSRAIADIKSGSFDGSTPGAGGVSAPATIFTAGTQTIGGATGTVAPSGQMSQPVRAYVLSSDVANGLEADTLLQQRRQFP